MASRRRDGEGHYNFWPVYSDIALSMVLLLMLVLLAQQTRSVLETDVRSTIVKLRQEVVASKLRELGVVSTSDGNTQLITLNADSLFASDSPTLKREGRELLLRVHAALVAARVPYTRISVEGHADHKKSARFREGIDVPVDGGNWWLSAERAVEVVQLLQRAGVKPQELEVVGRSYYTPIDSTYLNVRPGEPEGPGSAYDASLRRNRRIALRIFYSKQEIGS